MMKDNLPIVGGIPFDGPQAGDDADQMGAMSILTAQYALAARKERARANLLERQVRELQIKSQNLELESAALRAKVEELSVGHARFQELEEAKRGLSSLGSQCDRLQAENASLKK